MRGRLLVIIAAWGFACPALAVINPEFTPVHLVRQSEQVWLLTLQATDRPDRLSVRLDKALHGVAPERAPLVDLSLLDKAASDAFRASALDRPALLFVARPPDAAAQAGGKIGLLHVAGRWHRLIGRTPLVWQLERVDRALDSTWNGGTQMLARAVEYILADPGAVIPAVCDAAWAPQGPLLEVTEQQRQAIFRLQPVTSIVADFNGDGLADRVQVLAQGGLLHRGEVGAKYLAPTEISGVQPRGEPRSLSIGDFEADGKLDLLICASEGCSLWTNAGGAIFSETFDETGELAALAGASPSGAHVCDINNDGRQDVLLWYADRAPQMFFNRGFRCFGAATTLSLDKHADLGGNRGIVATAVADFNGDGCQDLAAVTSDGSLVLVPRDPSKGNKLSVTVSLPPQAAGPLTVSALDGKRPLGAQVVQPGQPAFFGKTNKGPLTLSWRSPGGEQKTQQIIVLKPMRVSLDGP